MERCKGIFKTDTLTIQQLGKIAPFPNALVEFREFDVKLTDAKAPINKKLREYLKTKFLGYQNKYLNYHTIR